MMVNSYQNQLQEYLKSSTVTPGLSPECASSFIVIQKNRMFLGSADYLQAAAPNQIN